MRPALFYSSQNLRYLSESGSLCADSLAKFAHNSKVLALPSNLYAMAPDDSRKTIAELIATLPEEERLILTLHLVNMVSVSEIAEKLGVPERAVTSVITSGRSRLIGLIL